MRGRRAFAAVGLGACLLLAACGSDGGGGSSAGTSSPSGGGSGDGGVRGVTADAVVVGGLVNELSFAGAAEGAQARFERANRDGGVHGRTIEFLGSNDDGGDPSRNQSLTRKLIDSDEVFAVVPTVSDAFLPQSSDLLVAAQAPFVGWGFMPGFCGTTWGFGFNGCLISEEHLNSSLIDAVVEAVGKDPAETRFAFQGKDTAAAQAGVAGVTAILEARDEGEITYSQSNVPSDGQVTDWSPYVQPILASDPDVIMVFMDFANEISLTAALYAAGFEGPVANFDTYVPGLLEQQREMAAALEGAHVATQVPPVEGGSEAIELIQEDLEAAGFDPNPSLGALVGWFSADEFVQMLEAAGPDLTPEAFDQAINVDGWTYDSPEGGVGPVSFPTDHDQPQPCSAVVKVEAGAYVELAPMTCFEVITVGG